MASTREEIRRGFLHAAWNGNIKVVRTYLSSYGLSYSAEWSDGYILLRDALKNGHAPLAGVLLDAGARVNNKTGNPKDTPLHHAVEYNFKEIVERLLTKGARVNDKNQSGSTPLHCATRKSQNVDIVKLLLKHNALVNASDKSGETPLHIAVKNRNVPIAQILLNHGASVSCPGVGYNNYSPLHTAADKGFQEMCELLLSKGASVNALSARNGTPLHLAVQKGRRNLVKLFLQYGVELETKAANDDGDTCLHVAAGEGRKDVVNTLLANGFSVDVTNSQGVTPAFLALKKGHTNIVRLFLERGADVNIQDKNGNTILCTAVEKRSETFVDLVLKFSPDANNEQNKRAIKIAALQYGDGSGKIIDNLLQYGFKVHLKGDDADDVTVLHAAVENGYFQLVEDMLKSCQDVVFLINASDSNGCTSLHVASGNRREDIVKLLISLGADVNALTLCSSTPVPTKGKTPLFYSVKNNDINISKLLLKYEAEANGCLLVAVQNKNLAMVELLLLHGADPNAKDKIKSDLLYGRSSDFRVKADSDDLLRKWGVDVKGENFAGTRWNAVSEALSKYYAHVNEAAYLRDSKCSGLKTPFTVAAENGNADITTMLLDKGAAVNVALMPKKVTALHIAVHSKMSKLVDVLLKQPDIDFDCEDFEKRTPLHYAAKNGDVAITVALLKRGAGVNCRDHLGKTPLHCAAEVEVVVPVLATYDGVDIVEALLRSGADPNARDAVHGYAPLHYWAANKKAESKIFYCLLKYGADVDSKSKTEETPLCVAVKNRYKDKVSVLLKSGADVNIVYVKRNEDRRSVWSTPLQEAGWEYERYDYDSYDEFVEDDDDTNFLTIGDLLCRHVIMLNSAEFYVNARDMHSLDSGCAPADLDKYRKKCEEELSLIKQTRVVGNPKVSFYDFLTKSPNKLASLLRRENMVAFISSKDFWNALSLFVIYGDLINNPITMALKRGNVLKTATPCIGKMFSIPDLCADSISDYLRNVDLNNFVEACKKSEAKSSSD